MFPDYLKELLAQIRTYKAYCFENSLPVIKELNDLEQTLIPIVAAYNGEDLTPPMGNTVRVHTYQGKSKFFLRDENSDWLRDAKKKRVVVTEGIEVVPFSTFIEEGLYTKILVWLDGTYYEGFLESGALVGDDEDGRIKEKHLYLAFLNDLEHAVFRVEKRIHKERNLEPVMARDNSSYDNKEFWDNHIKTHKEKFDKSSGALVALKDRVKKDIEAIKKKDLNVSSEILNRLKQQYENSVLKKQEEDIVGVTQKVVSNFYETYNPKQEDFGGRNVEDLVLFVPLYNDWFQFNDYVANEFDTFWGEMSVGISWKHSSGDVIDAKSDRGELIKSGLLNLKDNAQKLPSGKVTNWIKTNVSESFLNGFEVLIFLHQGVFKYDLTTFYADYVAVKQQFGNISIFPIQSIVAHEVNMSKMAFGSDTHLDVKASRKAHQTAQKEGFDVNKTQTEDPNLIDDLYSSESYLELMSVGFILNELKKLQ